MRSRPIHLAEQHQGMYTHVILKRFKGEDVGRPGEGETIQELRHRKWTEIRSGSIDLAKEMG